MFEFSTDMINSQEQGLQNDNFAPDYSNINIPKRYWGVTFEKHPNNITEGVKKFATAKSGVLIIQGANGSGKTETACAMFTYRIEKRLRAGQYLNAKYEICPMIRSSRSYAAKQNELEVLRRYYNEPFLVIDEVGKGDNAEMEKQFLSQVLSARYDNELPTVIITNWTSKELSAFLGEDIRSRFFETAIIKTLTGDDWRIKGWKREQSV